MKLLELSYHMERKLSDGDYGNVSASFTAAAIPDEGQSIDEAVAELRELVWNGVKAGLIVQADTLPSYKKRQVLSALGIEEVKTVPIAPAKTVEEEIRDMLDDPDEGEMSGGGSDDSELIDDDDFEDEDEEDFDDEDEDDFEDEDDDDDFDDEDLPPEAHGDIEEIIPAEFRTPDQAAAE